MKYFKILFLVLSVLSFTLNIIAQDNAEYITITVKKGDTLAKIARKYLEDAKNYPELLKYNNVKNVNMIYPGRKLKIPS